MDVRLLCLYVVLSCVGRGLCEAKASIYTGQNNTETLVNVAIYNSVLSDVGTTFSHCYVCNQTLIYSHGITHNILALENVHLENSE
jgi:hypothetical protein